MEEAANLIYDQVANIEQAGGPAEKTNARDSALTDALSGATDTFWKWIPTREKPSVVPEFSAGARLSRMLRACTASLTRNLSGSFRFSGKLGSLRYLSQHHD